MKKGKTINPIKRINICKELALTAREVRAYFGGSVVTWWRHGDEEWWSGASESGIICIIRLSSMRGKSVRLPINSMSSLVHRMCR